MTLRELLKFATGGKLYLAKLRAIFQASGNFRTISTLIWSFGLLLKTTSATSPSG
jgi:hypothetical protein